MSCDVHLPSQMRFYFTQPYSGQSALSWLVRFETKATMPHDDLPSLSSSERGLSHSGQFLTSEASDA